MKKPLLVGVTGIIGSGKTTVCKIFESLNTPVFYADQEAKKILSDNPNVKEQIIKWFGKSSYIGNELNRKHIAAIAFNQPQKLQLLNGLIHPLIEQKFTDWALLQSTTYVVKEAALLFESKSFLSLDAVIAVQSNESQSMERTVKRDQISVKQVRDRMKNQFTQTQKIALSDFVINNEAGELLLPQVLHLHHFFSI